MHRVDNFDDVLDTRYTRIVSLNDGWHHGTQRSGHGSTMKELVEGNVGHDLDCSCDVCSRRSPQQGLMNSMLWIDYHQTLLEKCCFLVAIEAVHEEEEEEEGKSLLQ